MALTIDQALSLVDTLSGASLDLVFATLRHDLEAKERASVALGLAGSEICMRLIGVNPTEQDIAEFADSVRRLN